MTSPTCASTPFARAVATAPGSSSIAVIGSNPRCAAATASTPQPQPQSASAVGGSSCSSARHSRVVGCDASPNVSPRVDDEPVARQPRRADRHRADRDRLQVLVPGRLPAVVDRRARDRETSSGNDGSRKVRRRRSTNSMSVAVRRPPRTPRGQHRLQPRVRDLRVLGTDPDAEADHPASARLSLAIMPSFSRRLSSVSVSESCSSSSLCLRDSRRGMTTLTTTADRPCGRGRAAAGRGPPS